MLASSSMDELNTVSAHVPMTYSDVMSDQHDVTVSSHPSGLLTCHSDGRSTSQLLDTSVISGYPQGPNQPNPNVTHAYTNPLISDKNSVNKLGHCDANQTAQRQDGATRSSSEQKSQAGVRDKTVTLPFQMEPLLHGSTENLLCDKLPNIEIKLFRPKPGHNVGTEEDASDKPRYIRLDKIGHHNILPFAKPIDNNDKPSPEKEAERQKKPRYMARIASLMTGKSKKSPSTSLPNLSSIEKKSSQTFGESPLDTDVISISEENVSEKTVKRFKKVRFPLANILLQQRTLTKSVEEEKNNGTDDNHEDKSEETTLGEDAVTFKTPSHSLSTTQRERSYSLISSPSGGEQTTTQVNFTRIPSYRGRAVRTQMLTRFSVESDGGNNLQRIKDATHIHPLPTGDVIVTDTLSNKIVLFDRKGNLRITFAVESGSEPWAVCMTGDGALAVTLKRQGCVSLWSTSGEPMIEFGQSTLSAPSGIVCDSRNRLLVTDEEANRVFIFNKHGKLINELRRHSDEFSRSQPQHTSTEDVTEQPFFKQPRYACVTPDGNYVIADSANHCVKVFDMNGVCVNQFGEYGRMSGQMKFPYGVTCDGAGNIYVADHYNNRVSVYSKKGDFIEDVLSSDIDDVKRPKSIAIFGSTLYITYGDLRANKIASFRLLNTHEKA